MIGPPTPFYCSDVQQHLSSNNLKAFNVQNKLLQRDEFRNFEFWFITGEISKVLTSCMPNITIFETFSTLYIILFISYFDEIKPLLFQILLIPLFISGPSKYHAMIQAIDLYCAHTINSQSRVEKKTVISYLVSKNIIFIKVKSLWIDRSQIARRHFPLIMTRANRSLLSYTPITKAPINPRPLVRVYVCSHV